MVNEIVKLIESYFPNVKLSGRSRIVRDIVQIVSHSKLVAENEELKGRLADELHYSYQLLKRLEKVTNENERRLEEYEDINKQ